MAPGSLAGMGCDSPGARDTSVTRTFELAILSTLVAAKVDGMAMRSDAATAKEWKERIMPHGIRI
jgi:hypothetical protein